MRTRSPPLSPSFFCAVRSSDRCFPSRSRGRRLFPVLLSSDSTSAERILDFFTANIRNPNTRKAYAGAVASLVAWCERHGMSELRAVRPTHIATYIEELQATLAAPSIKL